MSVKSEIRDQIAGALAGATFPIDTTTGFPARVARSTSWRTVSDAMAEPLLPAV